MMRSQFRRRNLLFRLTISNSPAILTPLCAVRPRDTRCAFEAREFAGARDTPLENFIAAGASAAAQRMAGARRSLIPDQKTSHPRLQRNKTTDCGGSRQIRRFYPLKPQKAAQLPAPP
jgi:hypothetical protein